MADPKERCNRCMQPAEGYAYIGMFRYCHGDRDCYRRQQQDDVSHGLFGRIHLYDLRPKPKPCLAVRNRQEPADG